MSAIILTQEDLQKFKTELFAELKKLISEYPQSAQKKWLKSYEVRNMLGISRGTLQHLYDSHQLPATRIGGLLFYDYDDIQKLIMGNATSSDIQAQAIKNGMLTMQVDGLIKALRGETTIEEVLRVSKD